MGEKITHTTSQRILPAKIFDPLTIQPQQPRSRRFAPLRPAKRSRQQRLLDALNLCVEIRSLLRQHYRLLRSKTAGYQTRRKSLGTNLLAANRDHQPLDKVFQLANIP